MPAWRSQKIAYLVFGATQKMGALLPEGNVGQAKLYLSLVALVEAHQSIATSVFIE
jgi:hypothetical protein